MADEPQGQTALGDVAARQLANATKTVPQLSRITPRWLTQLLQWLPVEAGIYRLKLYCSLAVLTEVALAVLDGVETVSFHEY